MSDAYLQRERHPVEVGRVFGFLTVTGATVTIDRIRHAPVRCQCGANVFRRAQDLLKGNTRSCGCMKSAMKRAAIKRHGMTGTPEYRSWHAMRQRCSNPKFTSYPNYGAKGVQVCGPWQVSFEAFYADMGSRPTGTTLDRWPNRHGNYEPGNCRWATPAEQRQNSDRVSLSPSIVRDIRSSADNCSSIARQLGVHPSIVYKARDGQSWGNV